jgi:Transposase, Mutator family
VLTDVGAVDLAVPRVRAGSFEPQIVRKGQTRLEGFNDPIIALYARGMTTRDIRAHAAGQSEGCCEVGVVVGNDQVEGGGDLVLERRHPRR